MDSWRCITLHQIDEVEHQCEACDDIREDAPVWSDGFINYRCAICGHKNDFNYEEHQNQELINPYLRE